MVKGDRLQRNYSTVATLSNSSRTKISDLRSNKKETVSQTTLFEKWSDERYWIRIGVLYEVVADVSSLFFTIR